MEEKTECLYSDVMPTDTNKFLVTVTDPLQLTLVTCFDRESQDKLGLVLQEQLELIHSHAFIPKVVYVYPQSA